MIRGYSKAVGNTMVIDSIDLVIAHVCDRLFAVWTSKLIVIYSNAFLYAFVMDSMDKRMIIA